MKLTTHEVKLAAEILHFEQAALDSCREMKRDGIKTYRIRAEVKAWLAAADKARKALYEVTSYNADYIEAAMEQARNERTEKGVI